MRLLKSISLCAFLWLGNAALCYAGVPVDYLTITEQDAALALSGKDKRTAAIALDKVKGQPGGIPFVSLTIEDAEFRRAIGDSLSLVGLHSTDAGAKYALRAVIVSGGVPFFQMGSEPYHATYSVQYELYNAQTGKNIFSKRIETVFKLERTANMVNVNRGYVLAGGAIRENIKTLVVELLKLKL